MPFSKLLGNDQAKVALTRMVEQHSVPHTLLFAGPDGIGKKQFALALAASLMGSQHVNKLQKGIHPDLHLYLPEGKAHLHSMEAMRGLIDEVGMPPFESPVKVFIIDDAHQMLPSSSNALLKTLEEPGAGSYFILLTSQPERLLPTIVSRCRKIPFFPIAHQLIAHYAETQWRLTPSSAHQLALLSQGSLARAAHSAAESQQDVQALTHQLLVEGTTDYSRFAKLCTQLESAYGLGKTETEEALDSKSPLVDELFEKIAAWYRDLHLVSQGGDATYLYHQDALETLKSAALHPIPPLERVFDALARAQLALERHCKLRTVLEEVFFQLS